MLSLKKLNEIKLQPNEVVIIDNKVTVFDTVIIEEKVKEINPELFPFVDREEIISEAIRLGKRFKDTTLKPIYFSGVKDINSFVSGSFDLMRKYFNDTLFLKDRVSELQIVERKVF